MQRRSFLASLFSFLPLGCLSSKKKKKEEEEVLTGGVPDDAGHILDVTSANRHHIQVQCLRCGKERTRWFGDLPFVPSSERTVDLLMDYVRLTWDELVAEAGPCHREIHVGRVDMTGSNDCLVCGGPTETKSYAVCRYCNTQTITYDRALCDQMDRKLEDTLEDIWCSTAQNGWKVDNPVHYWRKRNAAHPDR